MDSSIVGSIVASGSGVLIALYQINKARKAKREDDRAFSNSKMNDERASRQDRMDAQLEARYDNLQQDLNSERLARQGDVASERTERYKQIERLDSQIKEQAGLIDRQGKMIELLSGDIRVRDDYIMQLRQDIADGKPPPPRAWPVSLMRGTNIT